MIICIDFQEVKAMLATIKKAVNITNKPIFDGFDELKVEKVWLAKMEGKRIPLAFKRKNKNIKYMEMDKYLLDMHTFSKTSHTGNISETKQAIDNFYELADALKEVKGEDLKTSKLKRIYRFWN